MENKSIPTAQEYYFSILETSKIPTNPEMWLEFTHEYASMKVGEAKKEWENEIKELKQEIYFLNNSSNFQ